MPLFRRLRPRWTPDWRAYDGQVDGQPAAIRADVDAIGAAPVAELPVRVEVTVRLADPRPDGSPSAAQLPALYAVEDRLATGVERRYSGRYVGRYFSAGSCRFVYQLPSWPESFELDDAAPFMVDVAHADDPDWKRTLELFRPDHTGLQRARSKALLDALASRGDRVGEPRPIEHVGYFASSEQAKAAGQDLRGHGYGVAVDGDEDGNWTVRAVRRDAPERIDPAAAQVLEVIERHGGTYDGWGCDVVR